MVVVGEDGGAQKSGARADRYRLRSQQAAVSGASEYQQVGGVA
eukprot:IDg20301t1